MVQLEDTSESIALFHGNYRWFNECPVELAKFVTKEDQTKTKIKLTPFANFSEKDELAEFRILNYKDRVIIRFVENSKSVLFGYNQHNKQLYAFDINGMMVVRGPVLLQQFSTSDNNTTNVGEQDQENENRVKYSGLLTLNITGYAYLDLSNTKQGVRILLPNKSNYGVERTIPYRFQQKNIVQRQRDKLQSTEGMMSLETFDYMLCG